MLEQYRSIGLDILSALKGSQEFSSGERQAMINALSARFIQNNPDRFIPLSRLFKSVGLTKRNKVNIDAYLTDLRSLGIPIRIVPRFRGHRTDYSRYVLSEDEEAAAAAIQPYGNPLYAKSSPFDASGTLVFSSKEHIIRSATRHIIEATRHSGNFVSLLSLMRKVGITTRRGGDLSSKCAKILTDAGISLSSYTRSSSGRTISHNYFLREDIAYAAEVLLNHESLAPYKTAKYGVVYGPESDKLLSISVLVRRSAYSQVGAVLEDIIGQKRNYTALLRDCPVSVYGVLSPVYRSFYTANANIPALREHVANKLERGLTEAIIADWNIDSSQVQIWKATRFKHLQKLSDEHADSYLSFLRGACKFYVSNGYFYQVSVDDLLGSVQERLDELHTDNNGEIKLEDIFLVIEGIRKVNFKQRFTLSLNDPGIGGRPLLETLTSESNVEIEAIGSHPEVREAFLALPHDIQAVLGAIVLEETDIQLVADDLNLSINQIEEMYVRGIGLLREHLGGQST